MGDVMYSIWFDNMQHRPMLPEYKPGLNHEDRKRNADVDVEGFDNATTGKRQKTLKDANHNISSEDDDSWIDDLFMFDAEAGIDVQPVDVRQNNIESMPIAVDGPQDSSCQQHDEFLANVVGRVLSKIGGDDEESLLGEFSRSFMEDVGDESRPGEIPTTFQQEYSQEEGSQTVVVASSCCLVPPRGTPPQATVKESAPFVEASVPTPLPALDNFSSPPRGMSDLESTKFTINSVNKCEQPMLLTLTSFPFRVLYTNSAYGTMAGNNTSIIGKTFYDIFVNEGKEAPSFGACPSLVGRFNEDIVRVHASSNKAGVYSTIQVRPILKKSESPESGLRYYAVTLKEVKVPNSASIVYLPTPSSGSMVKF
jgi:hypothetical protein